ncbi:MAG: hypothetical protein LC122_12100 [Chitinophagales bacterium]|nr:hypothetical protein [Chitinophagales bacterium]
MEKIETPFDAFIRAVSAVHLHPKFSSYYDRNKKPGEVIESLSPSTRELLKNLKSDDMKKLTHEMFIYGDTNYRMYSLEKIAKEEKLKFDKLNKWV